jgi:hypothetical protein
MQAQLRLRYRSTIALPPGSTPAARSSSARTPRERKSLAQHVAVCPHEGAVVARIEQQQGHVGHVPVPELERESSFEGLTIAWPSLGFDPVPPIGAQHDGVPGTPVARVGEWHLGSEAERGMQILPKPFEQGSMGLVSQRFTGRVGLGRQLKTNGREQFTRLLDREARRDSSLDPAVLSR